MINDITEHLNKIINIRRTDSHQIIPLILEKTLPDAKPTQSNIVSFFLDIVDKFDWGKVHNPLDIDNIYKFLDRADDKGPYYFRWLDTLELAVRNYLVSNNISFSNFINAIVGAMTTENRFNLKRRSLVASEESTRNLLNDHTWLATLYLLTFTDLMYIIRFDLSLQLSLSIRNE